MRLTRFVIGLIALAVACTSAGDGSERAISRIDASLETRSHEGRLPPAGRWRPFVSSRAGLMEPLESAASEAYASLRRAVAARRNAETLLAAGTGELLAGELAIANAELSEAVALAPGSVDAWNALSVALLAEPADSSIESTVRAYDAASIAAGLSPQDPSALFNLGVAASRLGLSAGADFWQRLLAIERDPDWRAEIEARRSSLPAAGVSTPQEIAGRLRRAGGRNDVLATELVVFDPQSTREAAFEFLLPEWGDAVLDGDRVRAAENLRPLEPLARVLSVREHDPLLANCLDAASSGPGVRVPFARGMVAYGGGRVHQRQTRFEDAQAAFATALADLRKAGTPAAGCAAMVQAALAHAIYQTDGPARAFPHLRRAHDSARSRGYRSLAARTDWLVAIAHAGEAEPALAIAAYERALAGYARTGETANLCSVARASADLLRVQGEWVSAWPRLSLALRCAVGDADPVRRYLAFFEASLFASDALLPRAALAFQEEAVAAATQRNVDSTIAEAFTRRAMLHARVGNVDEARRDLARAREAAARIASPGMSAYQRAWAARVDAELALRTEPRRAAAILDQEVVDLFMSLERTEVPRILLARARALRQTGEDEAAERALLEGLRLVERHVLRLEREDQRLSYVDAEWDLAAEMVEILVDRGHYREALLQAHRRAGERPPFDSDLCSLRADGAHVYAFVSLPRELLLFACTRSGLVARRITQPASVIESQIQSYRRLLRDDAYREDAAAAGRRLFELLFGWSPPRRGAPLLIIPDGVFGLLPYASLIDPASGRFLIENHEVALLTTGGQQRSTGGGTASQTVVLVAPGAGPPLPRVADEVRQVARAYDRSIVLAGPDATADALKRTVPAGRVVHFAGHAKANPRLPWASYLSVTPDLEHPEGRIEASEIATWRLSSVDLVVLSACESVAPSMVRGDSMVGLAKAFLRAGSHAVVGSLWDVEDDSTSQLMAAFHRANRASGNARSALREAQLQLLQGVDPTDRLPRNWAGFIAVTTEFRRAQ